MRRPTWQLYGTLGCHLCEQAEHLLQQFSDTRAVQLNIIDIALLPDAQMHDLATKIPVLLSTNQSLNWPFSLLDLMRMYQQDTAYD